MSETSKEVLAAAYFGQHAAHYATSGAHTDPASLERFCALAGPAADWCVVDVATGAGHGALTLAPLTKEVIAVDLTPAMLHEARSLARERELDNMRFAAVDVHGLPFPDAFADLVTCRRAAHHFTNIGRALAEMGRILKPGGVLLIDDRSVPDDPVADRLQQELDTLHDPSHVRQYSQSEWAGLLEKAGFVLEEVEMYTRDRPMTAFTQGAPPGNETLIRRRFEGFDEIECKALTVSCHNGEYSSRHWYILLRARRQKA